MFVPYKQLTHANPVHIIGSDLNQLQLGFKPNRHDFSPVQISFKSPQPGSPQFIAFPTGSSRFKTDLIQSNGFWAKVVDVHVTAIVADAVQSCRSSSSNHNSQYSNSNHSSHFSIFCYSRLTLTKRPTSQKQSLF